MIAGGAVHYASNTLRHKRADGDIVYRTHRDERKPVQTATRIG